MEKKEIAKFNEELLLNYSICPECGLIREHQRYIHSFVCECGNKEWYCERIGDSQPFRVKRGSYEQSESAQQNK